MQFVKRLHTTECQDVQTLCLSKMTPLCHATIARTGYVLSAIATDHKSITCSIKTALQV
jgi:hypothetical protein